MKPSSDDGSGTAMPRSRRAAMFGRPLLLAPLAAALSASPAAGPGRTPFAELVPRAVLHVGRTADWVLVTPDAVWTGSTGPNAVHRIDPRTDKLAASIPLPGQPCGGLAAGFGALWVPLCGDHPALAKVDLKTDRVAQVLPFGPAAPEGGIAASADSVWLVTDKHGTLVRVDPTSGKPRQTVHVPPGSYNLRHADGALYVTRSAGAGLTVVDAASGKVTSRIPTGPHPRFLTVGDGFVWTLNQGDGTMTRISTRIHQAAGSVSLNTPGNGGDIAFGHGRVWTTMSHTPLSVTDAASDRVLHQWTGPGGDSIGIGDDAIWITDYGQGTIARIPLSEIARRLAPKAAP